MNVYCACGHERRQHSRNGCTQADPDGKNKCPCRTTYNDLGPRGGKGK